MKSSGLLPSAQATSAQPPAGAERELGASKYTDVAAALRPAGQGEGCAAGKGPCRLKDKSPLPTSSGDFAKGRTKGQTGYNLPKHVRNCANQGGRAWWVWSWLESSPAEKTRRPYTCGSWRCDGPCARHNAHVLFARLQKAIRYVPLELEAAAREQGRVLAGECGTALLAPGAVRAAIESKDLAQLYAVQAAIAARDLARRVNGNGLEVDDEEEAERELVSSVISGLVQELPKGWVFVVLTIDRAGHYSGEPWENAQDAYRSLSDMSGKWMKRLRRRCEKLGWTDPGNRWAMVIEAHRSGWPHANLLLYCPELAAALDAEREERELIGLTGRDAIKLGTSSTPERGYTLGPRALLGDISTETGWGIESTAEGARNNDALANYVVKLAGVPDENINELAKLTQTPKAAPFRFRRLRSGKGFLPPANKDSEATGALVKRETDRETGYTYAVVPAPKGGHRPERREAVEMAQRLEDRCIEQDEEREWYERKDREGPPSIPLVTRWSGERMLEQVTPEPQTWAEAQRQAYQQVRKARLREKGLAKRAQQSLPLSFTPSTA